MNLLAPHPWEGFTLEFWEIYQELGDLPDFRSQSLSDQLKTTLQVANLLGAQVYDDRLIDICHELPATWRAFYLAVKFVDLITTVEESERALHQALKQTNFLTEDRNIYLALVRGLLSRLEAEDQQKGWWYGRLRDSIAVERAIQLNRVVYSDRSIAIIYINPRFDQVIQGELAIAVKSESLLWTCDHISTNKRVPVGCLRKARQACRTWQGLPLEGEFRDRVAGERLARFLGLEVKSDRATLRPTKQNFT